MRKYDEDEKRERPKENKVGVSLAKKAKYLVFLPVFSETGLQS